MHLFGAVLTAKGTAANNRGENEGTVSTLQKIIRNGEIWTTVSAEAIRYALREVWLEDPSAQVNRQVSHQGSAWADDTFQNCADYVDDDVLGFMRAGNETISRRGVLEITRAISTTPWNGDVTANFASPRANPAVTHGNPIPYAVEQHHTRYQYGFAMTPDSLLRDKAARVEKTLLGLQNLRRVAGNHARFLFDFSPEIIVLRWTPDPAPRMLLCFDEGERGRVSLKRLARRLASDGRGDICASELTIGYAVDDVEGLADLENLGATVLKGIKVAVAHVAEQVREHCK